MSPLFFKIKLFYIVQPPIACTKSGISARVRIYRALLWLFFLAWDALELTQKVGFSVLWRHYPCSEKCNNCGCTGLIKT